MVLRLIFAALLLGTAAPALADDLAPNYPYGLYQGYGQPYGLYQDQGQSASTLSQPIYEQPAAPLAPSYDPSPYGTGYPLTLDSAPLNTGSGYPLTLD